MAQLNATVKQGNRDTTKLSLLINGENVRVSIRFDRRAGLVQLRGRMRLVILCQFHLRGGHIDYFGAAVGPPFPHLEPRQSLAPAWLSRRGLELLLEILTGARPIPADNTACLQLPEEFTNPLKKDPRVFAERCALDVLRHIYQRLLSDLSREQCVSISDCIGSGDMSRLYEPQDIANALRWWADRRLCSLNTDEQSLQVSPAAMAVIRGLIESYDWEEVPRTAVQIGRRSLILSPPTKKARVFIGHGHSSDWKELRDLLQDRLGLDVEEFTRESTAGVSTQSRLQSMLDSCTFAFLIMTAEDATPDGGRKARDNVIHEIGLFQGRLGFERAVILLQDGCSEFSNITGLGQIRFEPGKLMAKSEEIRRVLEREGLLNGPH